MEILDVLESLKRVGEIEEHILFFLRVGLALSSIEEKNCKYHHEFLPNTKK